KVLNLITISSISLYKEPGKFDYKQVSIYINKTEQVSIYMNEVKQILTYMDEAEQIFFYMDEAKQKYIYIDKAKQVSISISEAKVGELSSFQSKKSNLIQLKGSSSKTYLLDKKIFSSKANCNLCEMELVYQDGTILNFKKYFKIYKSRVPELNESKVKQGGISVIEILNNKASLS
ncbi:35868_t:CDS:2, partial [Gigaspora margarita]